MIRRPLAPPTLDFEAFGTSVGLALISGALSLLIPGLLPLTAALGALAVAGWAAGRRRHPEPRARKVPPPFALVAALVGFALLLAPPHALEPYRGLGVGLGLLPLWAVTHARRSAQLVTTPGAAR